MPAVLFQWLKSTLEGSSRRSNVTIVEDGPIKNKMSWELFNALVTGIGFPALDRGAKDNAELKLRLRSENTTAYPTGEGEAPLSYPVVRSWAASDFRLQIDGLDSVGAAVKKIGALNIAIDERGGDHRRIEFPNITMSLPMHKSGEILSWFDSFVTKGNSRSSGEKNGQLLYFSADNDPFLILNLTGIGIMRVTKAGGMIDVEMYCERMELDGQRLWQKQGT